MSEDTNTQFHVADYVVFAASLALSAGIGVYYGLCDGKKGGEEKNAEEGITGGKSMGILPVSFSVLASFLAAPFVIGTPGEMYCFGTMYSLVVLGFGLATPFVSFILIPAFHKLDINNGYQVNYLKVFLCIFSLSCMKRFYIVWFSHCNALSLQYAIALIGITLSSIWFLISNECCK